MKTMFNKIKPYMGGYIKYTYAALAAMFAGLIASAIPFFMVYRIQYLCISPAAAWSRIKPLGVFSRI